jgi:tetratricopeptide (TPR) repeat protein
MKPKSPTYRFDVSILTLFFAVTLMFGGTLAHGQGRKGGVAPPSQGIQTRPNPAAMPAPLSSFDEAEMVLGNDRNPVPSKNPKEDNCFLPPLNGLHMDSVGVGDLQVPEKTQREYADGCAALRNRKMAAAEGHLRKAVNQYAKYSAAWVLLGQVLVVQQKTEEARHACSQPLTASSNYLPAYLCLTDISVRLKNWDEVLQLSTRALEVDSTTDAAAYGYNAMANLNLHRLPEAEKSALKALEIDRNRTEPRTHYLLAQIYEAKGDRAKEVAQLREYLNYSTDPKDTAMVRNYLAELEEKSHKQ